MSGDYDDDRVRGFPAFGRQQRGASFAKSWWGEAWIEALEQTSLDRGRLSRGRTYARTGHVQSITISPGRIAASVQGSDLDPYETTIDIEELTDAEWERFLDNVAGTAGHIAALLDKDMPHDLVQSAEDSGVRLLPGVGDLEPDCTCLDWGYPCKHAAALCYQVSWLLDVNPFLLLLMRGRGERELLDELQRRNAERSPGNGVEASPERPVTDDAAAAFAAVPASLPDPPAVPDTATPALLLPPTDDVDVAALAFLAGDAAHRAAELLASGPATPLDDWQDTVRIAATCRDQRVLTRLADATDRRDDLVRAATAWTYGGATALDALESSWSPPPPELHRAWSTLESSWGDDDLPEVHTWRNRWTVAAAGKQLRYGRDRRWYPYQEQSGSWWPAGPPDRDPTAVLAELLGH